MNNQEDTTRTTSLRRLQIGVMGSAADLRYQTFYEELAESLGREIAKYNAVLIFGAEKDYDSLSTAASRGARRAGGLTLGITYGKGLDVYETADIIVATGLERGGGREFSLVLSCDGIITINGGSGTLNEMLVAYQAGIPIVAMEETGGWSGQMSGKYFDDRKRIKVNGCKTPSEAVETLVSLIQKRIT